MIRQGQILHDVQNVNAAGIGLSSADTNYFNINSNGHTQHVDGNRWAFMEVNGQDGLFHHYAGGGVGLNSDTTPGLFDVASNPLGTLVDGNWHHVAIVQDLSIAPSDGSIQDTFLYIDGNLVDWQTIQGAMRADQPLGIITLGAQPNTRGGDASRLYYDDYAVWSRALDPSEISLLATTSLMNIPEPSTWVMGSLGLLAFAAYRKRTKK